MSGRDEEESGHVEPADEEPELRASPFSRPRLEEVEGDRGDEEEDRA